MKFIDRIKTGVKDLAEKIGAATGMGKEFKDVFEVGGVPAFNQFYYFGIFIWKYLYKGYYSVWHTVLAPTIENQNAKRELFRMDVPKAVCSELSSLVWSEECSVSVSMNGVKTPDDKQDELDAFVQDVLEKNAFFTKMREHIEQSAALGGGAIKVRADVRRDENGTIIPGTERIMLDYCMADQFVPTSWDNAQVFEGVFISRKAKDGYYYTRLEWHKWQGLTYFITNELFRSEMRKNEGAKEPQDILGYRYPLAAIYPFLSDKTPIEGIEQPLFAYYRMPGANNLDDNSPLGMSIYGNALSTLRALDICYDSFVREFRLGKKRIIVPARAVRTIVDPISGITRRYFDANDETYEALSTENPDDLKITDASVELRVDEHIAAINAFLSILCLQIGFSPATFSFDAKGGLKTATEVVSENSKTYKTIKDMQNMIRPAIERTIENIIAVAVLYDMKFNGRSVADMVKGGYHINVTFDDGVTQDRQTNITEGITLMNQGVLSKLTFLTDPKYGQGLTPEKAEEELARVREESAATMEAIIPKEDEEE